MKTIGKYAWRIVVTIGGAILHKAWFNPGKVGLAQSLFDGIILGVVAAMIIMPWWEDQP